DRDVDLDPEVVRVAPRLDRLRRAAPDHVGARAEELAEAVADEVVADARPEVVRAADLAHHVAPEDEVDPVVRVERERAVGAVALRVAGRRELALQAVELVEALDVLIAGREARREVDAELVVEQPVLALEREAELEQGRRALPVR